MPPRVFVFYKSVKEFGLELLVNHLIPFSYNMAHIKSNDNIVSINDRTGKLLHVRINNHNDLHGPTSLELIL